MYEHMRNHRSQPWESRLACYMCTATEGRAGCCLFNAPEMGREVLRALASVNANSCRVKKLGEKIWRGSVAALLATGFFKGERCWGPLCSSLLGSMMRSSVMKAERVCCIYKGCWSPQKWRLLGSYTEQASGNHGHSCRMGDMGSPCPFPCSHLSLDVSALPASWLGKTEVDPLYSAWKAGKVGFLSSSPFPGEGNPFRSQSSFSVLSSASLGYGMM